MISSSAPLLVVGVCWVSSLHAADAKSLEVNSQQVTFVDDDASEAKIWRDKEILNMDKTLHAPDVCLSGSTSECLSAAFQEIGWLKANLTSLETRVASNTKKDVPAFQYYNPGTVTNPNTNSLKLQYSTLLTDSGEFDRPYFDSSGSVFTAPIDGIYSFAANSLIRRDAVDSYAELKFMLVSNFFSIDTFLLHGFGLFFSFLF